ncbi:MAG TPA: class I SAM-dependent methyltransferase, partial [Polyangiaceae bacterium]
VSHAANVIHLGCRTGYPDQLVARRLTSGYIVGLDASQSAIDLARAKGALITSVTTDYETLNGYPTRFPAAAFTHGLMLHPSIMPELRRPMLEEMSRLILPRGQLLVSLPMRGSFQELFDLLRECSVKFGTPSLGHAIDAALALRPTVDGLTRELHDVGFTRIDVELRPMSLGFQSGRDLMEDPIVRLLILPEFQAALGTEDVARPMRYVEEAINRYWSEDTFELTLNVGCASARRAE